MKRIILIVFIGLVMAGCKNGVGVPVQPEQQAAEGFDYNIQFLFEVDGVKMYRFKSEGHWVYFTTPSSRTYYQYTTRHTSGKTTHIQYHDVECINN